MKLANVTIGYPGRRVLTVPELDFGPGEVTFLLGRNGSGKSTLLKSMAGILPYGGSIRLTEISTDGGSKASEVRDLPHRERARIVGYLPQMLAAPDMDVETLVLHGRFARLSFLGTPSAEDRRAAEQAFDITGTADLRNRSVKSLSGGERQLSYLTMIIAQDPQVFLLDEPMSSMDITHQIRIVEILRKLKDRGKTLVVTSHDLPQSFALADRIALLSGEKLCRVDTPAALCGQEDLVRQCMGAAVRYEADPGLLYPYVLVK